MEVSCSLCFGTKVCGDIVLSMVFLCRYQKLVEGRLGNSPPQQDGTKSPGKYVIINDEADGVSEHGDDGVHVL